MNALQKLVAGHASAGVISGSGSSSSTGAGSGGGNGAKRPATTTAGSGAAAKKKHRREGVRDAAQRFVKVVERLSPSAFVPDEEDGEEEDLEGLSPRPVKRPDHLVTVFTKSALAGPLAAALRDGEDEDTVRALLGGGAGAGEGGA